MLAVGTPGQEGLCGIRVTGVVADGLTGDFPGEAVEEHAVFL